MNVIPDKRDLVSLVRDADRGAICLPNFQRDFVWPRDQVADLLRSVLRGYFIGSLLLLRCDPDKPPFDPLFVRGSRPNGKVPRPDLLILDGQQRLTALLYAMVAPALSLKDSSKPRLLYVDLDLLIEEHDNDEIVFDRTGPELDGLDRPEVQYARHTLPCTTLLKARDFYRWRDGFEDWLRVERPDDLELFRTHWRDAWGEAVGAFLDFQVPLVELDKIDDHDPDSIGRVCAIFEKLNSTGMELTVYDLLTARLYPSGIKLHDLWDASCGEHKLLAEWSEGHADQNKLGVLVLRTLALLRGLDPKPRALINLAPANFNSDWRRAARAVDRALELMTRDSTDGFGAFAPKWVPGLGILPVLAALRLRLEELHLREGPRAELRRWYWSNVFLERYSSAVESKSRKDYSEFLEHWTNNGPMPAVFAEAEARIGSVGYSIADSASNASAVYSGVMCLLSLQGARDFRLEEAIGLQNLQDHHIFPRAYLTRHGIVDRAAVNGIANRTLISDETNNLIRDQAPAAYLQDARVFPHGPIEVTLAPHYILSDGQALMAQASEQLDASQAASVFGLFRKAREAEIVRKIRQVTGVKEPTGPSQAIADPAARDA